VGAPFVIRSSNVTRWFHDRERAPIYLVTYLCIRGI
jgi:hypothetical protein